MSGIPKIGCVNHDCDKCQALEQPADEPVAKVYRHGKSGNGTPWHGVHWFKEGVDMPDGTLLYTTPPAPRPAREWVGLTDEEAEDLYFDGFSMGQLLDFARAIEAKLKEKNT